jgi:hypothetical protein
VQHLSGWLLVYVGLYGTTKLCAWQLHRRDQAARVHSLRGRKVSAPERSNCLPGVRRRQLLSKWISSRASVPWRDVFERSQPEPCKPVQPVPFRLFVHCRLHGAERLHARLGCSERQSAYVHSV